MKKEISRKLASALKRKETLIEHLSQMFFFYVSDVVENENGDIAEQQIKEIEAKGKSRNFGCSSQAG